MRQDAGQTEIQRTKDFDTGPAGIAPGARRPLDARPDAMGYSDNPDELKMNLQGIYLNQGGGGLLKR